MRYRLDVVAADVADTTVQALLEIAWWDWDAAKVTRNLERIVTADLAALRGCEEAAVSPRA